MEDGKEDESQAQLHSPGKVKKVSLLSRQLMDQEIAQCLEREADQ